MSDLPEIQRSLGRIEGQLGAFIDQMKVQDDRSTKLEVRVTKTENRLHYWAGGGTLLGALIAFFIPRPHL